QLVDGTGGQVPPRLDQELGLGGKPVLEVADRDSGFGGDGPDAGARVTVLQQRISRGVDDLVPRALCRCGPGHTYVPAYIPPSAAWGGSTCSGDNSRGCAEHRTSLSKPGLRRASHPRLRRGLPGLPG